MTEAVDSAQFVRETHGLVRDLMAPRLRRYWTDFLITIAIAHGAFVVYILAASGPAALAFVVCGLAMYRAAIFTHEITHRRGSEFRVFSIVWNLLCGIPLLMPSFMYGDHESHHTRHAYGTGADPEYLTHTAGRRLRVVLFLLLPIVYPMAALGRFLFLTPLALVSRRMDRLVWTYTSSLYVMNETYRREYDATASHRSRWLQEAACCAWAWFGAGLVIAGYVPWGVVAKTYLVVLFWIGLNQLRTLAAHRYANDAEASVSYLDQLLDTNTFPRGKWLPELWAPVGLRYHALHHLLPMLPYHAMGEAHTRLIQGLPPGSPYFQTIRDGLWPTVIAALLDRERGHLQQPAAGRPRVLADRPDVR
jgi:fatty acid desaturase